MTIDYHILKYSHDQKAQVDFNIEYFEIDLYKSIWQYIYEHVDDGLEYKQAILKMYSNNLINISQLNKLQRCIHWSLPCQYSIDNNSINLKQITCEICPFKWLVQECQNNYQLFKQQAKIIQTFNLNVNNDPKYINFEYVIESKKKYKKIALLYLNLKLKDGIKVMKIKYDLEY